MFQTQNTLFWLAKRLLTNPLRIFLVALGVVTLAFSMQGHAYTANAPVQLHVETNELTLQQGSELPLNLRVQLPNGLQRPAHLSFDILYPAPELNVDGQLNDIDTYISLNRQMRIRANPGAQPGDYVVQVILRTILDNRVYANKETILVHVVPKTAVTYFTSPYTTAPPSIANIAFSQTNVSLHRNENAEFSVSFLHKGSATDYLVRLSEQPIGIQVRLTNDIHRFVENNQSVTAFVEVSTDSKTPFQNYPLRLEVYNLVTGEKTFLGTVLVRVEKQTNLELSVPFREYLVAQNGTRETFLTITNAEFNEEDVVIETSSSLVQPGSHIVHLPSKASVSIPIVIYAGEEMGGRTETIYVMNPSFSKTVSFIVRTVEKLPEQPVPSDENVSGVSGIGTGLISGAFSPILGILILIIAALLIFSHSFRDWVRSRLPKTAEPEASKSIEKTS